MGETTIEKISQEISCFYQTQWRLNGVFLSRAMDDGDAMRQIIHRNRGCKYNVMESFVSFYETNDREQLLNNLKGIKDYSTLFSIRRKQYWDYELGQPGEESVLTLYDGTRRESNWLNPAKYDEPHTMTVIDEMVDSSSFEVFKKFKDAKVIDVLKETLSGQKEYLYFSPHTNNWELNKLCQELIDDEEFSALKYFKALTLLNADMEKSLQDGIGIKNGEIEAAALLLDKAPSYFDKIDYVEQYNLYKGAGFREILKFSYLTTFTKQQEFDKQHLDGYLDAVANAGHWMRAQDIVTRTITQNSRDFGGINGQIMDLNIIKRRPTKFHGMENKTIVAAVNGYYDRDLERQKYIQLYFGTKKQQR